MTRPEVRVLPRAHFMKNNRQGFGLVALLAVIAIMAAISWGAFYTSTQKSAPEEAFVTQQLEAIERAEEVKSILEGGSITQSESIVVSGVVVDHNMENVMVGTYLELKNDEDNSSVFIVYNPYEGGVPKACLNKVDGHSIDLGKKIEARGTKIDEIGGKKVQTLMLSTCESNDSYIRVIE